MSACRVRPLCGLIAWCIVAGAVVLGLPGVAEAHKVNAFAFVEAGRVKVQAYFSRGTKAQHAQVLVYGPEEELLLKTETDAAGECSFAPPKVADLKIVVETADGHRAEYRLAAEELGGVGGSAPAASLGETPAIVAGQPEKTPSAETGSGSAGISPNDVEELRTMLRQLEASVNALRREVNELRTSATLKDALAGAGFILGLTGIATLLLSRRGKRPPHGS